ncbi:MAG: sulfatase-like hydrolase/transferase, partial [Candidatus Margulisiibacteriota bacterium]
MVVGFFVISLALAGGIYLMAEVVGSLFRSEKAVDYFYSIIIFAFLAGFGVFYSIITFFWIRSFKLISGDAFRIIVLSIIFVILGSVYICFRKNLFSWLLSERPKYHYVILVFALSSAILLFNFVFAARNKSENIKNGQNKIPAVKIFNNHKSPNVFLITIDSLSRKHISFYGYKIKTTPFIDEFARESYVFDQAHSNALYTSASMLSINSSLYPSTHRFFKQDIRVAAPSGIANIFEILRSYGFSTFGPIARMKTGKEIGLGKIDSFFNNFFGAKTWFGQFEFMYWIQIERSFREMFGLPKTENADVDTINEAKRYVKDSSEPIFLWIHLFAP